MFGSIFTYVMTYGGALAALRNPYTGFLIYVAFSILKPESLWSWSVPQGHYSRIVAVALLLGWLFHGMGSWNLGRSRGIVLAFIGYWVWSMLSALAAPDQQAAWGFVENTGKVLLPFLVGITTIKSVRELKQLAWVIVLAHGFLAYEFNLSYSEGWNRVVEIGHGGMDSNCVSVAMVSASGLALFLGLSAQRWWTKMVALGSMLLMVHVVLFSFSRGGMLGLVATVLVGFCLIPKKPIHYLVFVLCVALGLGLAGTEVREEFVSTFAGEEARDSSAQSRLVLWTNAADAMVRNPILGLGPDHFPLVAKDYGWPTGKEAHNTWVQIGAELGFPGLLFLVTFYSVCVVRLRSLLRNREAFIEPWLGEASAMVIVSVVGFGLAAVFVTVEGIETPYYITLIGAGVLKLSSVPKDIRGRTKHTAAPAIRILG